MMSLSLSLNFSSLPIALFDIFRCSNTGRSGDEDLTEVMVMLGAVLPLSNFVYGCYRLIITRYRNL